MARTVEIPAELVAEVEDVVEAGEYPSVEAAVKGLLVEALRNRRGPPSPDRNLPPSERPTDVDADDVNWF